MQRRLLLVLGVLGALAGVALILALWLQKPPHPKVEIVQRPPPRVALPPDTEPRPQLESGTLKGRVVDGKTGAGIKGAEIVALTPHLDPAKEADEVPTWGGLIKQGSVFSGADGYFALAGLTPNYWNLWVEKRGYAWTTLPRAKFDEEHVIKLYPACSVRGQVVYPDGFPAPGVRIEYHVQGTNSEVFSHYKLKDYYTTTKADGTFLYEDLPPGKFTVEVYPPDHVPSPWRYEPPLEPAENRDLGVHKLFDGFGMTVHVVWGSTNEPVPDVEVVVRPIVDPEPRTTTGQRRRTDANGVARFKGLGAQSVPNPNFKVVANLPNGPVSPDDGEMHAPGSDVTIRLRKDGIVKGTVVRPNGEPLEEFFVDLEAVGHLTQQLTEFGENGTFAVYQVPGGAYKLHVRHGNLVDAEMPIDVVEGKELDVGVIRLEEGAQITGMVRRSNGKEIDDVVRVTLSRKVQNAATGHEAWEEVGRAYVQQDGSYALKGIPPGDFWIWPEPVKNPTATTDPEEITVPKGTPALQKDLTLWSEGLLHLRFVDRVQGGVREVVAPPTYLVDTAGKEIRWKGIGHRLRPGSYTLYVELADAQGVPTRYKAREVEVFERRGPGQDDDTKDPIEVRLFEIRDGN